MASMVGEVQEAERGGGESQGDGVWEARNGWQTTRLFCPAVGKETRPRPPTHFFLKTHPPAPPQATHPPNVGQTREEIISAWPSAQWAQQPEPTHPLSQTPQGLHGKDVERKPRTEGQKNAVREQKGEQRSSLLTGGRTEAQLLEPRLAHRRRHRRLDALQRRHIQRPRPGPQRLRQPLHHRPLRRGARRRVALRPLVLPAAGPLGVGRQRYKYTRGWCV